MEIGDEPVAKPRIHFSFFFCLDKIKSAISLAINFDANLEFSNITVCIFQTLFADLILVLYTLILYSFERIFFDILNRINEKIIVDVKKIKPLLNSP